MTSDILDYNANVMKIAFMVLTYFLELEGAYIWFDFLEVSLTLLDCVYIVFLIPNNGPFAPLMWHLLTPVAR